MLSINSRMAKYNNLNMRYVAAYLLAVLGGQESPANADLEKILSSVGIEADAERLTRVIKELKGKSIDDLIKEGREKLSSMPVGGGAAPAAAAAGAPAAAAGGDKKEAKKEEKKEESESEDDDMATTTATTSSNILRTAGSSNIFCIAQWHTLL
ncbi:hypothetical protein ACLKA6_005134 [Drosophila palustris]